MSEELKPCPFCGGEAEVVIGQDGFVTIGCGNSLCDAFCVTLDCSNEEIATEVWNTRAEKTCTNASELAGEIDYLFKCSKCGCTSWLEIEWISTICEGEFNYCPNCGAKVVIE